MTEALKQHFADRLERAVRLIDSYGITYEEMGIFGSYARGDYTNQSDIDICLIVKEHPERGVSGSMRCDAEEMGVDVVYVRREYFTDSNEWFAQNLRKDYKRIK